MKRKQVIHTKVDGPVRSFFNILGALALIFSGFAIYQGGDAKMVLVPAVLGGVFLGIAELIPKKDRFEG